MQPFQKHVANNVRDAFLIDEQGIEDDMTWLRDEMGFSDAGVEGTREIEFFLGYSRGLEHHVAAAPEGGDGLLKLILRISEWIEGGLVHAEEAAVIGIAGDFLDKFPGGRKPATVTVIIIFVEVFGDFLNDLFCVGSIDPMKNDRTGRGLASWIG